MMRIELIYIRDVTFRFSSLSFVSDLICRGEQRGWWCDQNLPTKIYFQVKSDEREDLCTNTEICNKMTSELVEKYEE